MIMCKAFRIKNTTVDIYHFLSIISLMKGIDESKNIGIILSSYCGC